MKKTTTLLTIAFIVISFSACKKDYHCAASKADYIEDLHCEKCSKSEAEDFKKSLEAEGYTDVNCVKE